MKTLEHDTIQSEAINLLHRWGYGAVLPEHRLCDVVAVPPYGAAILGLEVERSARNVLRNLSRNFEQGCECVLIVCPDFKSLGEVARKLSRALPPDLWVRTGLATVSALHLIQPLRLPAPDARTIQT